MQNRKWSLRGAGGSPRGETAVTLGGGSEVIDWGSQMRVSCPPSPGRVNPEGPGRWDQLPLLS